MSARYAALVDGAEASPHAVEVRPLGGGRFAVAIDGDEAVWRGAPLAGGEWLLREEASGRTHALAVADGAAGQVVAGAGLQVNVEVLSARAQRLRAARPAPGDDGGPAEVRAAMPGRVVAVLVAPGQAVCAQAPLAVVEAMKMENELRAPFAGRVVAVHTQVGEQLAGGAVVCALARDDVG